MHAQEVWTARSMWEGLMPSRPCPEPSQSSTAPSEPPSLPEQLVGAAADSPLPAASCADSESPGADHMGSVASRMERLEGSMQALAAAVARIEARLDPAALPPSNAPTPLQQQIQSTPDYVGVPSKSRLTADAFERPVEGGQRDEVAERGGGDNKPPPRAVAAGDFASLELFGDLHEGGHPGHASLDDEAEDRRSWGVLLPWSPVLLAWDLVCSTALLAMCFYLPFRLAFLSHRVLSWPGDAWLLVIDMICLVDVGVAMSSAYYDYLGHLETRRVHIVRRYLRGWFLIDLASCFPLDWLYLLAVGTASANANLLMALRALRLGRALRLTTHRRVFTYLNYVFSRLKIRAAYSTILQRTILTIIFAHCNCCFQFLVAVRVGLPPDCWVVRANLEARSVSSQYMAAIFHTTSQILAVGNGLVGPERDEEFVTFIISLVLGANLYAVFVGTLISVIEDANGSHREYCKRIDMLHTWMAQRQLPRALRRKLEAYYEILFPGANPPFPTTFLTVPLLLGGPLGRRE